MDYDINVRKLLGSNIAPVASPDRHDIMRRLATQFGAKIAARPNNHYLQSVPPPILVSSRKPAGPTHMPIIANSGVIHGKSDIRIVPPAFTAANRLSTVNTAEE